ncbi:hypothetical protein XA68_12383 [Ophiocordyceps unilateralis]|uniref:Uncharacterized protein n=1 Tax=Ophiocordyceps unilateralis TaxID=268505 RepID=A0A2A9PMI3_OPHUN|nr:hypothetical protein XA68_12383 [Ophiocordyceps unilateralis]
MKHSTETPPAASWLSPLASCCYTPFMPCFRIRKGRVIDDGTSCPVVVNRQPLHQPMLSSESHESGRKSRHVAKAGRKGLSTRSRPSSDAASRRPLISAPSNFRHLQSGPGSQSPAMQQEPPLTPFESGSYTPDSRQSPVSPHFSISSCTLSPPPACFSCRAGEGDRRRLRHGNDMFHIPRRQVNSVSPVGSSQDGTPPRIPPKAQGRSRVSTAPEMAALRERVAGAMNEVERLQRQIDEVVERQSLYANSRPSTSHSTGRILPAMQPMPSVPALPPVAPSFAERLNSDGDRSPIEAQKTSGDATAASPTQLRLCQEGGQLAAAGRVTPRPPLRKKKSFTHVSDWLFPQHDGGGLGTDKVASVPQLVNECPRQGYTTANVRQSFGSLDSASTWDTEEGDGGRTAPTTRSAGSDVGANQVPALRMSGNSGMEA